MIDIVTLIFSLKAFYLILALVVISLMLFYVRGLTSQEKVPLKLKATFYGWVFFLITIAVLFHLLTAWKVPWVHWEIKRGEIKPDQEFSILAKKHQFILPKEPLKVKVGKIIKFKLLSEDLTYGFGVFRGNGGMEFQMQVLPGHSNEIIWIFSEPGHYSIRSTEYAGIETSKMYLKNVIEVFGRGKDK